MKRFFLVILFFNSYISIGQKWYEEDYGIRFTLMASFGTHQNSIGAKISLYGGIQNIQINSGFTSRYFITNLGSRCHFWEHRIGLGGVVRWGKKENPENYQFDVALHNSKHNYSLGYGYLWYFDPVGTKQRSGTWNLGVKRVDIQFENDVFAGQSKDRFRTGALSVGYRDSIQQASIKLIMWTGETRHSTWYKDPNEKQPSGYRDLTKNPYGYLNHGILTIEYQHLLAFNQSAGARLGWDSEYIRHVFQNRISHDLVMLPKNIERNTPHYPMLDEFGNNVWQRKDARKPKFYGKLFIGDDLFY